MPRIFVSYRRDDAGGHAGRLVDRLRTHFGAENVFADVDDIRLGVDYRSVLRQAVQTCQMMIVVIGRRWLGERDAGTGARRIHAADDWVRIEVAEALARDIQVVPVLVQGSALPTAADLPADLAGLASRQATALNDAQWDATVAELMRRLGSSQARRRIRWAAAVAVVALVVGAVAWRNTAWPARPVQPIEPGGRPENVVRPIVNSLPEPALWIGDLSGANRPLPLDGYSVITPTDVSAGGSRPREVYPRGAKIAIDLSRSGAPETSVTLRRLELHIESYTPGVQPRYRYTANGDNIIGSGPIKPLVFHVALFGKKVGKASRLLDAKRRTVSVSSTENFFDTPDGQLWQLTGREDSLPINVEVTAEEAGLYGIRFVVTYAALGKTMWKTTEPLVWIYYDGH